MAKRLTLVVEDAMGSNCREYPAWEAVVYPSANGKSTGYSGQSGAECGTVAPIEHDSEHKTARLGRLLLGRFTTAGFLM
jgi:hypothetical protein